MATITAFPVRIKFDVPGLIGAKDVRLGAFATVPRGNTTDFEIAIYLGDSPLDLSNIASLRLEIRLGRTSGAVLTAAVDVLQVDMDPVITGAAWMDGTAQHATFRFTAAQMNQDLQSAERREFTLVLSGLTTPGGEVITFGITTLVVVEDVTGSTEEPPEVTDEWYTAAQVDALLAMRAALVHTHLRADISDASAFGRARMADADAAAAKAALALVKADVGLANADNTSDANKPVSTAQAAAIAAAQAACAPASHTHTRAEISDATPFGRDRMADADAAAAKAALSLVKGDVGLANADNTSDANKPVSAAQAAALASAEAVNASRHNAACYPSGLKLVGQTWAVCDVPIKTGKRGFGFVATFGGAAGAVLGGGTGTVACYLLSTGVYLANQGVADLGQWTFPYEIAAGDVVRVDADFDGSGWTVYFNGIACAVTNAYGHGTTGNRVNYTVDQTANISTLGTTNNTSAVAFTGEIRAFYAYNRSRTAAEILTEFRRGGPAAADFNGPIEDLVAIGVLRVGALDSNSVVLEGPFGTNQIGSAVAGARTGGAGAWYFNFQNVAGGGNSYGYLGGLRRLPQGGRKYLCKAWLRASGTLNPGLIIRVANFGDIVGALLADSTNWSLKEAELTWPRDASGGVFELNGDIMAAGDSFDVDDFEVIPLGLVCCLDWRWNGVGDYWPDISGNNRHLNNPGGSFSRNRKALPNQLAFMPNGAGGAVASLFGHSIVMSATLTAGVSYSAGTVLDYIEGESGTPIAGLFAVVAEGASRIYNVCARVDWVTPGVDLVSSQGNADSAICNFALAASVVDGKPRLSLVSGSNTGAMGATVRAFVIPIAAVMPSNVIDL